jgi:signal transduction histidine kinase
MTNRRTTILTVISAVLFAFCLPAVASAQWDRDRDYRRDRRDDDRYGRDNGRYGRNGGYDARYLRAAAERIRDNARNLERDVDRLLDNSRVNGTRREDRINNEVKEFRHAADRFRSRVGDNGNDRHRGYQEAQYLMQTANRTERMLSRLRVDSRTYSDWRQIKQDLRTVANAYGLRYDGYDDGYYRNGNGGYDPRDRDRDRDRNGRDDNWWRRLPGVINGRP